MVRWGWLLVPVVLLAALPGAARAAVQLTPGQELTYTGKAVWKQTVSGGPPEAFRGRVRLTALVTRADPAAGYSVDLMTAVTREAPEGGRQAPGYADLNTIEYRPDLSRTTPWPRTIARDPLGDLIQVLDVPLAPGDALKPGDISFAPSEDQMVLFPQGFPAVCQVEREAVVAGRHSLVLTRRLASHPPTGIRLPPSWKHLPPPRRDFGGGSFEELEEYTNRMAVDPATMEVTRQDLHARQRRHFGQQSEVIEFSAAIALAHVRQLSVPELALRARQAAALESIEHPEQPAEPNDAATRQALAGFRRQFPGSPYLPVADQFTAALDQPGRGSDLQAFMEGLQGRPAPGFRLKRLDGREQTLGAYRGRLVLLNFFGNT